MECTSADWGDIPDPSIAWIGARSSPANVSCAVTATGTTAWYAAPFTSAVTAPAAIGIAATAVASAHAARLLAFIQKIPFLH